MYEYQQTPLMYAIHNDNVQMIEALLNKDAAVNTEDPKSKQTALHVATSSGNEHVIQLLLERGANVNAMSKNCIILDDTPLLGAIENYLNPSYWRFYEGNCKNDEEQKKLAKAYQELYWRIMIMFLNAGADANLCGILGDETPLTKCCKHYDKKAGVEVIDLLLHSNAK